MITEQQIGYDAVLSHQQMVSTHEEQLTSDLASMAHEYYFVNELERVMEVSPEVCHVSGDSGDFAVFFDWGEPKAIFCHFLLKTIESVESVSTGK